MRSFGAAAATLVLAGTFYASGPASASAKTTLTLWQNYGTVQGGVATTNLVKAFEKANPNITIKIVAQPGTSYFAQLQAASISGNGPDLAVMWTGIFTLQYSKFLQNLKGNVPAADLAKMAGMQWVAPNFDTSQGAYVVPLDQQFYIGFYNKKLFKKAGITSVPTDWAQLFADCAKLKAIHVTPIVYGNGGQAMSYLMIGSHSLADWKGLYDGTIPWTDKSNVAQLAKWASLQSKGYTNKDVLTKTNNLQDFESGKAAMLVDGTWDTQQFTTSLGSNVGAFVPPFSNTPVKGVVAYDGDGYSVMKYSKNKAAAYKFLDYLTTAAAAKIIDAAGLIPDLTGATTSNSVNQQMLNFVAVQHMTAYPMLDNFVQGNVVNAGNKVLPAVLGNQQTPLSALQNMRQIWSQLPAAQRSPKHYGGF
jgi:raffinose/stachyose/melibiose transport system substrate-binding protein